MGNSVLPAQERTVLSNVTDEARWISVRVAVGLRMNDRITLGMIVPTSRTSTEYDTNMHTGASLWQQQHWVVMFLESEM